jgi:hypothetical protein
MAPDPRAAGRRASNHVAFAKIGKRLVLDFDHDAAVELSQAIANRLRTTPAGHDSGPQALRIIPVKDRHARGRFASFRLPITRSHCVDFVLNLTGAPTERDAPTRTPPSVEIVVRTARLLGRQQPCDDAQLLLDRRLLGQKLCDAALGVPTVVRTSARIDRRRPIESTFRCSNVSSGMTLNAQALCERAYFHRSPPFPQPPPRRLDVHPHFLQRQPITRHNEAHDGIVEDFVQ